MASILHESPWSALSRLMVTHLIRLGLHLNNVRLELVVVLYASLLFEEGTFFVSEIVQTLVQDPVGAKIAAKPS